MTITTTNSSSKIGRYEAFVSYLTNHQKKTPDEAEKIAKQIQDYIEPKLGIDEKTFYASTNDKENLPRTIHLIPDADLTLVCFNKKNEGDVRLGKGRRKHVHEAYDYKTGKIYARVIGFNDVEKECSHRLKGVPNIPETYATYEYTSPKSGKIKRVAIQELIEGKPLSEQSFGCSPSHEQAIEAIRTILKTLDTIHTKGITHGDLSECNFLFSETFEPMLIDLGEATIFNLDDTNEKFESKKRSDIASIGFNGQVIHRLLMKTNMSNASKFRFMQHLMNDKTSPSKALELFEELLAQNPN